MEFSAQHRHAAATLHERLGNTKSVASIGLGQQGGRETLFVYLTRPSHKYWHKIPSMWEGFPVEVRVSGPARAASRDKVRSAA
jgi:hypothetical protein